MKQYFFSVFKKFCMWFIVFGISWVFQNRAWGEQGKVFFFLDLGIDAIVVVILAIVLFLKKEKVLGLNLLGIDCLVVIMTLFATYVAAQIFGINFFEVYQIMTFGQCLFPNNKNK